MTSMSRQRRRALQIVVGLVGAVAIASPSLAQSQSDLPTVEPDTQESVDGGAVDEPPSSADTTVEEPDAATQSSTVSQSERFSCQYSNNNYTVMYNPESRPNEAFPWAIPQEMGGGWTTELRCLEIAKRLEEYRPDGLQELQTSTENGYNTVCVTSEKNSRCRLVFTVPPNQDAIQTRDSVFENLTIADSGQQTQGVTTYAGGTPTSIGNLGGGTLDELVNIGISALSKRSNRPSAAGIRLKPYLDAADGGTGRALNDGVPLTRRVAPNKVKGRQLQPNKFR
ncbi:MAG: COP23 domain-containing protein [Thermosynechococcaceae cyanobacterium]